MVTVLFCSSFSSSTRPWSRGALAGLPGAGLRWWRRYLPNEEGLSCRLGERVPVHVFTDASNFAGGAYSTLCADDPRPKGLLEEWDGVHAAALELQAAARGHLLISRPTPAQHAASAVGDQPSAGRASISGSSLGPGHMARACNVDPRRLVDRALAATSLPHLWWAGATTRVTRATERRAPNRGGKQPPRSARERRAATRGKGQLIFKQRQAEYRGAARGKRHMQDRATWSEQRKRMAAA